MLISKRRSQFFPRIAPADLFVPRVVDVCVRRRIEHLLVFDALEDAFLSVIDHAHVSGSAERAGFAAGTDDWHRID